MPEGFTKSIRDFTGTDPRRELDARGRGCCGARGCLVLHRDGLPRLSGREGLGTTPAAAARACRRRGRSPRRTRPVSAAPCRRRRARRPRAPWIGQWALVGAVGQIVVDRLRRGGAPTSPEDYLVPNLRDGRLSRRRVGQIVAGGRQARQRTARRSIGADDAVFGQRLGDEAETGRLPPPTGLRRPVQNPSTCRDFPGWRGPESNCDTTIFRGPGRRGRLARYAGTRVAGPSFELPMVSGGFLGVWATAGEFIA